MVIPAVKVIKGTLCSVPDCDKLAYVRGWCQAHYSRWHRHGTAEDRPRRKDPELLFWSKVDFDGPNGCWLWTAYLDRDGYGLFSSKTLKGRAARMAYLLLVGDISPDLVVDHLCRNRPCVNPYHLEPVTSKVNSRRSEKGERTHCMRGGHPLSGANLYMNPRGLRVCRRCHADNERGRQRRLRAQS